MVSAAPHAAVPAQLVKYRLRCLAALRMLSWILEYDAYAPNRPLGVLTEATGLMD